MSDVLVDQGNQDQAPAPGQQPTEPHLGWALAGLSAGAGVIHIAMTPVHAASAWQESLGFAAAGWFQLVTAGMVLANRGGKRFYELVAAANALFILVWVYSRTAGLPFGDNANVAESVGAIDTVCVILQAGVILLAIRLVLAPEKRSAGSLAPALCAVAALGLATAVITSPDAATHSHGKTAAAALTGLDAAARKVDTNRCDKDFNIPSYWDETKYLGVDTRWGGTPPAVAASTGAALSADGHDHSGGGAAATGSSTTTTDPDPFEGRGSPGLDHLVSATGLASTSELDAAVLVSKLSESSQADYEAWLWWLRSSGTLSHSHDAATATTQVSGHGGHAGPQPWVALTSQKQCDELSDELAEARATAMKYPTAKDAQEAGYHLTTGYVPGIAAHWIKTEIIDDTFEIDKPEMILYDGNGLDAHVVGLSYYLWHAGDIKPTQGFTGQNDLGHRHIGLCTGGNGVIIGDSTTTAEDCEARGGSKADGSKGWMSHAWVVPGCESPWGVFSAASPLLDSTLQTSSGKDDGHCAGSGVRDRYGMDDPAPATPASSEDEGATGTTGG